MSVPKEKLQKIIEKKHSFRGHFLIKNLSGALATHDNLGIFKIDDFANRFADIWEKNNDGDFEFEIRNWQNTLGQDGTADGCVTKRLFAVLKYGPLCYRRSPTDSFEPWPYTIATALSHGGRILIQLPRYKNRKVYFAKDDPFMQWLLGGSMELAKSRHATHGIREVTDKSHGIKEVAEVHGWEARLLPLGMEHLGLNIALGGRGRNSPYGEFWDTQPLQYISDAKQVKADGRHGHMYLGFLPGWRKMGGLWGKTPHCALLVGIEGSNPLLRDVVGHYHGPNASSSIVKVAGGIGWKHLTIANKPGEYDCLFVDLSDESALDAIKEVYQSSVVSAEDKTKGIRTKTVDDVVYSSYV